MISPESRSIEWIKSVAEENNAHHLTLVVENPNETDPRIPVETDPLFFFQLAPRIAKFSCRAESFCRVTKQPFSANS